VICICYIYFTKFCSNAKGKNVFNILIPHIFFIRYKGMLGSVVEFNEINEKIENKS